MLEFNEDNIETLPLNEALDVLEDDHNAEDAVITIIPPLKIRHAASDGDSGGEDSTQVVHMGPRMLSTTSEVSYPWSDIPNTSFVEKEEPGPSSTQPAKKKKKFDKSDGKQTAIQYHEASSSDKLQLKQPVALVKTKNKESILHKPVTEWSKKKIQCDEKVVFVPKQILGFVNLSSLQQKLNFSRRFVLSVRQRRQPNQVAPCVRASGDTSHYATDLENQKRCSQCKKACTKKGKTCDVPLHIHCFKNYHK